MEQLLSHELEYYKLATIVESDLIKITGCSLPCRYMEYKLVGSTEMEYTNFGFLLSFVKKEIVEENEVLVYEFISFVAEFGGALGLFLGFSFLTSWDLLEIIIDSLYFRGKTVFSK